MRSLLLQRPQQLSSLCSNPDGPTGDTCADFEPRESGAELDWWEPVGASYDGDLVITPVQHRTRQQQLELLDWHPMFTGRCPACEVPVLETDPTRVYWNCEVCGWKDDSV